MQLHYSYLSAAAVTNQGLKRKNNEDAYALFPEYGVFCVADGMGGAEDGEIASKATMDAMTRMVSQFEPEAPLSLTAMQAWICHALNGASSWMRDQPSPYGRKCMGTTIVGVCCNPESPDSVIAFHAGDSRAYHVHNGTLKLITSDHSLANAAGIKDENQLSNQYKNVIVRAVGLEDRVDVEMTAFKVEQGDFIILCSDGLNKMVEDSQIEKTIAQVHTVEEMSKVLVDQALEHGGKDNVTVVAISIGPLPAPMAPERLTLRMPPVLPTTTSSSTTSSLSGTPVTDHSIIPQASISRPQTDLLPSMSEQETKQLTERTPFLKKLCKISLKAQGGILLGLILATSLGLTYYSMSKRSGPKPSTLSTHTPDTPQTKTPDSVAVVPVKDVAAEARLAAEKRRQADEAEAARKVEAERLAAEKRRQAEEAEAALKVESERLAAEKVHQAEEAEAAARKVEAERRAVEALKVAEAARKVEAERRAVEALKVAEAARKVEEERRAAEALKVAEAARKVKDVAASTSTPREKGSSIKQLQKLVDDNKEVCLYYTFMLAGKDKVTKSKLLKSCDDARGTLVAWETPSSDETEDSDYAKDMSAYVKSLADFINEQAIQDVIDEIQAQGATEDHETRKTWEALLKEASELKNATMEKESYRKRLVSFVQMVARQAVAGRGKN